MLATDFEASIHSPDDSWVLLIAWMASEGMLERRKERFEVGRRLIEIFSEDGVDVDADADARLEVFELIRDQSAGERATS